MEGRQPAHDLRGLHGDGLGGERGVPLARSQAPRPSSGGGAPTNRDRTRRILTWILVYASMFAVGAVASSLVAAQVARWLLLFLVGMSATFGLALLAAGWAGRRYGEVQGGLAGAVVLVGGVVFVYDDTADEIPRATAIAPLILVGAIVSALMYFRWPKAASRAIAELAAEHGLRTTDRIPDEIPMPSTPLPIPVSRVRTIRNVVWGEIGDRTYVAFEVRWLEWRWVFFRRQRLGVCLAPPIGARLPELSVEPQGWVSHFVTRIAGSDVQLESDDFNRRFRLRAADRRYVYDVVSTRAMVRLIDLHPAALRISGDAAFCWNEAGLTADFLHRGCAALDAVLTTMPTHAAGRWGESTPPSSNGLRLAGRYGDEDRQMPLARVVATALGLAALMFAAMFIAAKAEDLRYVGPIEATVTNAAEEPPFGPSVIVNLEWDGHVRSSSLDTSAESAALIEPGQTIPVRFDPDDLRSIYWVGQMPHPAGTQC